MSTPVLTLDQRVDLARAIWARAQGEPVTSVGLKTDPRFAEEMREVTELYAAAGIDVTEIPWVVVELIVNAPGSNKVFDQLVMETAATVSDSVLHIPTDPDLDVPGTPTLPVPFRLGPRNGCTAENAFLVGTTSQAFADKFTKDSARMCPVEVHIWAVDGNLERSGFLRTVVPYGDLHLPRLALRMDRPHFCPLNLDGSPSCRYAEKAWGAKPKI